MNFTGNNDGSEREETFDWPETLKGKLYARLVVLYITKGKEERLDSLGVKEVNSNTWMFVFLIIIGIVLGVAVVGGVGFYFFFWKKKHNSVSLEQLNTDKGNDVQMAMMDKNNP